MSTSPPRRPHAPAPRDAVDAPLAERDIDALQSLLDTVPAPLEPLDVTMLDGFLCGVLVQPEPIPASHWLPHVTDADGRALPTRFDTAPLHAQVLRRHRELRESIARRDWFDPWVFELAADDAGADEADDDDPTGASDAVYPWVAGFATAFEVFPALMRAHGDALNEPLALIYRHLDADDLEDADTLIEEIESLEPPADLTEAVEGLVRATLLLADIAHPPVAPKARPARPSRSAGRPRR